MIDKQNILKYKIKLILFYKNLNEQTKKKYYKIT